MIYLEKDGVKVSTNDGEVAMMFEDDGYTKIQGRRYWGLVISKAAKKAVLDFVLPTLGGLVLFHFCEGRDYAAFVLGAYMLSIIRGLLSD